MSFSRYFGIAGLLAVMGASGTGCGLASPDDTDQIQTPVSGPKCDQVQAKDPLIAQLVIESWMAQYPLTRLSVAADGSITGANPPDLIAGDLALINGIPDARASVARALAKVSGLPEYGFGTMTQEGIACTGVPAWTPTGTTSIDTGGYTVTTNGVNDHSWKTTRKEFGQECPLVKFNGDKDEIDPPGDGSTALIQNAASTTGVRANAFGLCPSGTTLGTSCMLSYASYSYYLGRKCQAWGGTNSCLLSN
jgi:hypothetical protein